MSTTLKLDETTAKADTMLMHKNQDGSHVILVTLAILLVGIVGFAGYRVINKATNANHPKSSGIPNPNNQGPNYKALPDCGEGPVLTHAPMDLSKLDSVSPLGSINAPEHTIPTDHNYFMYKYERNLNERYKLVAPANVVVSSLGYIGGIENGKPVNTDYGIDFSPCKGLSFRISHVSALEGVLKDEIGPNGEKADCRTSQPTTQRKIITCGKNVDIKISVGELMGKVGSNHSAAWDFWAWKADYKNPGVTSPDYRYDADSVCGLDYFAEPIKSQIYALVRRVGSPKCGEIGQDKANTLQGSWFAQKDPEKARTDWNSHLTLGHTSENANKGVLAIAGKITDPAMYTFSPKHNGTINLEPSETKAGTVYCYQHDGNRRFSNGSMAGAGKTLLKLTDNRRMQAEHKSGTCTGSETLTNPTSYYR
jgi:hypothetical protein